MTVCVSGCAAAQLSAIDRGMPAEPDVARLQWESLRCALAIDADTQSTNGSSTFTARSAGWRGVNRLERLPIEGLDAVSQA